MNPNFLIASGAAVVVLVALGILGGLKADLEASRFELSKYEHQIDENKAEVEEIRRQRGCIRFWEEVLEAIEAVHRNRIVWSRQLETLALSVPEEMTLSVLSVRSADIPLPPDSGNSEVQRFGTRYEVRFQGWVEDARASSIIRRFSQGATEVPGFEGLLDGVELSSENPLGRGRGAGKEFVLTALYRTIDWQKGENP